MSTLFSTFYSLRGRQLYFITTTTATSIKGGGIILVNSSIKSAIKKAKLYQWQVAEMYGISESHFCRLLRHELPNQQKEVILKMVMYLSEAKTNE